VARKQAPKAKIGADTANDECEYLWSEYGPIPIAGKSENLIFLNRTRTVSRRTLKRNGKAWSKGQWFFQTEGAALAHRACTREADREAARRWEEARRQEQASRKPIPEVAVPINAELAGLLQLKAAMAAAHPDRGGSKETFIAAHKRYLKAKEAAAAPKLR
jgi:hypothetical protein